MKVSDSKFWDGYWILNQKVSGQKVFARDQNLNASWYGIKLYNLSLAPSQVQLEYQASQARYVSKV
jgi:hypothetical protein